MKTTKRSKMLLSSIAMLLVALVALGSATFAWYSINRVVTADTMYVKAAAPGGLEISLNGGAQNPTWASSVSLENMGTSSTAAALNPVALTFNGGQTNGIKTAVYYDGATSNSYSSTGTSKTATGSGYYVVDEIWVKNSSAKTGYVTPQVKTLATADSSFINLTLVDADATEDGSYAQQASDAITTADTYQAFDAGGATVQYGSGDIHHYYVIAWADGNNENCYTANTTGQANVIQWTINFTLADTNS